MWNSDRTMKPNDKGKERFTEIIIEDESRSVSDDENTSNNTLITVHRNYKKIPFFNFLPNEVCLNIFSYLSIKQVSCTNFYDCQLNTKQCKTVRLGLVCKEFYNLLHDDTFWEEKAKRWTHINTTRPTGDTPVLAHYIKKYQENERAAKDAKKRAIRAKRQVKLTKFKTKLQSCCNIYLGMESMEVTLLVSLLIWSVLLALRADEFIHWNYHYVFLPLYVVLGHILVGLLASDTINIILHLHGQSMEWKSVSTLTMLANVYAITRIRTKVAVYSTVVAIILAFIFLAEAENQDGWVDSTEWSLMPMWLLVILHVCLYCTWFPDGRFCNEAKYFSSFFGIAIGYVIWIVMFIWGKAEEVVDFSWYVAFTPVWIFLLCTIVAIVVISLLLVCTGELSHFIYIMVPLLLAWICLLLFISLLSYNLEQLVYDLPLWPWLTVYIPLFILEIGATVATIFLAQILRN